MCSVEMKDAPSLPPFLSTGANFCLANFNSCVREGAVEAVGVETNSPRVKSETSVCG